MPVVLLKRGVGEPGSLVDNEPALDLTPGEPKLWAGIGGVPTVLADPALLALLVTRVMNLEARIVVLEGGVWGVGDD